MTFISVKEPFEGLSLLRTGALSEGNTWLMRTFRRFMPNAVIGPGARSFNPQSAVSSTCRFRTSLEEMLDEVLGLITSIASLTLESKAGIWLVEEGSPDTLVLKAARAFA